MPRSAFRLARGTTECFFETVICDALGHMDYGNIWASLHNLDARKTNLCKEGHSTVSAKRQTEYCARSQDRAIELGNY